METVRMPVKGTKNYDNIRLRQTSDINIRLNINFDKGMLGTV